MKVVLNIYSKNSIWLIADRIVKICLSVVFTYFCADLLSKEDFGLYGFIFSFVSIFSVIGSLGAQELLTSHFLKDESNLGLIWVNSFLTLLASVIVCISLLFIYLNFFESNKYIIELTFLFSFTILIRPFEITQFLLDAQLKSFIYVKKLNQISILFLVIKTIVLIYTKSLFSIILVSVIESGFLILFYILITKKLGVRFNLNLFSFSYCKLLLTKIVPFLISAVMIILYVRIDMVFIKELLGLEELAYYSAATRLSEVWYVIPMAVSTSYFPRLNSNFHANHTVFVSDLSKLFNFFFKIAFTLCVFITLFSEHIVVLFYGIDYKNSIGVLQIHIWSLIAVFFGVLSTKWYILNNLTYFLVWRSFVGFLFNMVLNFCFITSYGIRAAALSTVISYLASDLFFDLISNKTRPLFRIKLNAIKSLFNISY